VFAGMAADFGAELGELEGADDHLQLLVASPPQVAVARMVHSRKGVSARRCANATGVPSHTECLWSPS
jgi:putative transposase